MPPPQERPALLVAQQPLPPNLTTHPCFGVVCTSVIIFAGFRGFVLFGMFFSPPSRVFSTVLDVSLFLAGLAGDLR